MLSNSYLPVSGGGRHAADDRRHDPPQIPAYCTTTTSYAVNSSQPSARPATRSLRSFIPAIDAAPFPHLPTQRWARTLTGRDREAAGRRFAQMAFYPGSPTQRRGGAFSASTDRLPLPPGHQRLRRRGTRTFNRRRVGSDVPPAPPRAPLSGDASALTMRAGEPSFEPGPWARADGPGWGQWDIWQAVYGTVRAPDGYPAPHLGQAHRRRSTRRSPRREKPVDLRLYLQENWPTLGEPKLTEADVRRRRGTRN